jgi:hypothetical protein
VALAALSFPLISYPMIVAGHRLMDLVGWTYITGARQSTGDVPDWGETAFFTILSVATLLSVISLGRALFRGGARRANQLISGAALAMTACWWWLVWLMTHMVFPWQGM